MDQMLKALRKRRIGESSPVDGEAGWSLGIGPVVSRSVSPAARPMVEDKLVSVSAPRPIRDPGRMLTVWARCGLMFRCGI